MKKSFCAQLCVFLTLIPMHSAKAQGKTPSPPEFIAWLPVSDAERALKAPQVEKDAGAEVLAWRVRVVDEVVGGDLQRVLYNYVRVKVFDDKGREKTANIDLAYREPGSITGVSGRTIKSNGSIVDLDPKTVKSRDLFRAGRIREKAVSFAMPGIEPGAIVDYRWKQVEDDNRFRYIRINFQRDLPVEKVTYYVKPIPREYIGDEHMLMMPFHSQPTKPALDNEGWQETSVENIPALVSEPFSPSNPNREQWALLYYHNGTVKSPDKYWSDEGKQLYHKLKEALKTSEDIKAGANDAVSNAKTDEEKIVALASYLRKHVRTLTDPAVTTAERHEYYEKLPRGRDRNLSEIFKSGLATSNEMNVALAGLAAEAGLDARLALVADRTEALFNPKVMTDRYFLDDGAVAVKTASDWKIVDASERLIAPGGLPWQKEGMFALISDPKEPVFFHTPYSPPDASRTERVAHLKLSGEGALAGDVEEHYVGHRAEEYREELDGESEAQREQFFHDRLGRMFPESEITNFKIDDLKDAAKPLRISYHLEAPQFAQVTGKRMLFQPNVFRRAQAALFTASERKNMIEFPYAWKDADHIAIELPAGFDLDNPDSPGSLSLGTAGSYKINMTFTKNTPKVFTTDCEFTFGNAGVLYYDAADYLKLKKVFDEIHIRDTHFISIKAN